MREKERVHAVRSCLSLVKQYPEHLWNPGWVDVRTNRGLHPFGVRLRFIVPAELGKDATCGQLDARLRNATVAGFTLFTL